MPSKTDTRLVPIALNGHALPRCVALMLAAISTAVSPLPALALEELPGEKQALRTCEKDVCSMILLKKKSKGSLSCKLTKTWAESSIKKGGKSKFSWGFGDARCSTEVSLPRRHIHAALTRPKHTVMLNRQEVRCTVERSGEPQKVRAVLSPKLKFRNGRAHKVWINLKELEGPNDIKGTVWTTAHLEDTLGIFHKAMIKGINKFMHRKCAKKYAVELGLKPKNKKAKTAQGKVKGKTAAKDKRGADGGDKRSKP
jgi:hypothetical protein